MSDKNPVYKAGPMFRGFSRSIPVAITQGVAMAARFAMLAVAARLSSVSDFGIYTTVSAVVAWAGVLVMGGWPSLMIATVPKEGVTREEIRRVEGKLLKAAIFLAIPQGLLLRIVLGENFTFGIAAATTLLLIAISMGTVTNETHRATGRVLSSRILFAAVPPLITVFSLLVFHFLVSSVAALFIIFGVALGWVGLWLAARASIQYSQASRSGASFEKRHPYNRRDFLVIKIAQSLLASGDVVVVAAVAGITASALYGVARRVATVAGLGLNSVSMLYGPRLSQVSNDPIKLRSVTREATLLSVVFSLPIAAVIGIFGNPVLRVFGADYAEAKPILLILLTGVVVSGIFGPVGTVVHVNGQERLSRNVMLFATSGFIICLYPATLLWGAIGAAATWAVATAAWNIALWTKVDYSFYAMNHPSS